MFNRENLDKAHALDSQLRSLEVFEKAVQSQASDYNFSMNTGFVRRSDGKSVNYCLTMSQSELLNLLQGKKAWLIYELEQLGVKVS